MGIAQPIPARELAQAVKRANEARYARMRRDHELELLLAAGVSLAEARTLVSKGTDHA